jgi:hypothetical protein
MGKGRKHDTTLFQRILKPEEKLVLRAAGKGELIAGFYECLAWYQHCYNLGLRPTMNYEHLGITAGILNDETLHEPQLEPTEAPIKRSLWQKVVKTKRIQRNR